MSRYLLDANVLIADVFGDHVHHDRAAQWLSDVDVFAVCPIVEGALVRFALRIGEHGRTAAAIVSAVRSNPRCEFWPDDISYADVDLAVLRGHRQVKLLSKRAGITHEPIETHCEVIGVGDRPE